jgi:hypothetical protein
MEEKLEKKCRSHELQLGKRYCLSSLAKFAYTFTVTQVTSEYVRFKYTDGVFGLLYFTEPETFFYEFPFTPLEQELL